MQAFANSAWLLLTDPNIAFILLVLGLWAVVLAVAVPGTGLPEAAAVICLALATVGLLNLPTTLVGLGLMALAMGLFIAEVLLPAHGALLVAGAIAMGVGGLVLFPLDGRSGAQLSWVTILGAPLLSAALFGLLIRQGLRTLHLPALQDLRRLVGSVGVTRTEVAREGTIYVAGEDWSATADGKIPPNTDVVVLARRGLTLKVEPAPRQPAADSGTTHSTAGPA
jgi:membrane-bound serine protease (ClpP class)